MFSVASKAIAKSSKDLGRSIKDVATSSDDFVTLFYMWAVCLYLHGKSQELFQVMRDEFGQNIDGQLLDSTYLGIIEKNSSITPAFFYSMDGLACLMEYVVLLKMNTIVHVRKSMYEDIQGLFRTGTCIVKSIQEKYKQLLAEINSIALIPLRATILNVVQKYLIEYLDFKPYVVILRPLNNVTL